MTRRTSKKKERVFRSVEKFRKAFLPDSYAKDQSEREGLSPYHVSLVEESLAKVKVSLQET